MKKTIYNPIKGEILPLSASKDEVHASEMLGKGALIIPSEGKVYAPFDGKVDMIFDTKHALGLFSDEGIELLIHVGMNTVELKGKPFKAYVKQGDTIKKGQILLEFNIKKIQKAGYEIETPIVITNSDDYEKIDLVLEGEINQEEILLIIE
jgi:glucose-specific phosphotransferase system IIA component